MLDHTEQCKNANTVYVWMLKNVEILKLCYVFQMVWMSDTQHVDFNRGKCGLNNNNNNNNMWQPRSERHTMKLCCRGDHEYIKGIPATVDSGLIATAWALKPGKPNSTVHICKTVWQAWSGESSQKSLLLGRKKRPRQVSRSPCSWKEMRTTVKYELNKIWPGDNSSSYPLPHQSSTRGWQGDGLDPQGGPLCIQEVGLLLNLLSVGHEQGLEEIERGGYLTHTHTRSHSIHKCMHTCIAAAFKARIAGL